MRTLHVVYVNYAYNRLLTTPDELLERYESLSGWADALAAAGARVSVVQRFRSDLEFTRKGVLYRFVRHQPWKNGSVADWPHRMHRVISDLRPDIVHVHGLQFARQAWQLKWFLRNRTSRNRNSRQLPRSVPVLLQDHANALPRHWLNRWTLRRALRRMNAVCFVSREQAHPWLTHGFMRKEQTIVELMESSTRFMLQPRAKACAETGLTGDPLCLWVGRLNENKDPLTVLCGFAEALAGMPDARLAMVYGTNDLLPSVNRWLAKNPSTAARVTLLGRQPHALLEAVYNSADFFLLGSHHEGSGFAVLEALSCGVVPVLTDIPSFRVLTGYGTVGGIWPVGNAEALARALTSRYSRLHAGTRDEVRSFFEANFSWDAIARRAMETYRQIIQS